MRTGDVVLHRPSGERWIVAAAYPEQGDMMWCGWPEGYARIADCEIVKAATDAEHWALVTEIAKGDGIRARYCRHLLAQREEPRDA